MRELLRRLKIILLKIKPTKIPNSWKNERKKFFMLQTPNHGNLGDQAIAYAQEKFIKEKFSDYQYIEIRSTDIYTEIKNVKKIISENDIVGIHGGGNLGDLYPNEEKMRRYIVDKIDKNKIISFPQTFTFSNTKFGKSELKKSQKSYENNNLLVLSRERYSYQKTTNLFKCKNMLVPDIVLSLPQVEMLSDRRGISTFFRKDKEDILGLELKREIISQLESKFDKINDSDTVIESLDISYVDRKIYLDELFQQFYESEMIITDRLHGMIIAYITKTPCIVFNNSNKKIEYVYNEWLKNCNGIHLYGTEDIRIESILDMTDIVRKEKMNNLKLQDEFLELINFIKQ